MTTKTLEAEGRPVRRRASVSRRWPRPWRLHRPRLTKTRVALLSVLFAILALWTAVTILSTSRYTTTVLFDQAGTGIGLPPPENNLDFGDVQAGGGIHRNIDLDNSGSLDTFVVVIPWGGIRDFLHIDDAFFNMSPSNSHTIDFSVNAPIDTSRQRHSGTVYVVRVPLVVAVLSRRDKDEPAGW